MSDPDHPSTRNPNAQDAAAGVAPGSASDALSVSHTQGSASVAAALDESDTLRIVPISFEGTANRYFKLFTVNLLLTIITLGIYSAWARVRTRRFFMGHTYIGKHNLEFDARPIDILISRILVAIVLGGLLFAEFRYDLIWSGVGIFLVGVLLLMPFALVRGRAFIARHTIHRTLRFRYRLEYRRPVILYLVYAFFAITIVYTSTSAFDPEGMTMTGGGLFFAAALVAAVLAAPLLIHFGHRIQIDQLHFGKLHFFYEGGVGRYYRESIKAFLLSFGVSIVVSLVSFAIINIGTAIILPLVIGESGEHGSGLTVGVTVISIVGFLASLLYVVCIAPYRAVITCLYWSSFRIGKDSAIESRLEWWPYARLLIVNYTLIILSLGLMYPWARVRAYRHVAERLQVGIGPETAAEYLSSPDDLTPLAGEFADVAGWDFDFGAI